jgi:hypothetical protein
MARYILALILLLAGGMALVAFHCDSINEMQQRVDLEELGAVTRSIRLTQYEEPRAYSLVNFSWSGSAKDRSKKVIVERSTGNDFFAIDTLSFGPGTIPYFDPDTLPAGQAVHYRLLLLDQGRLSEIADFESVPMEQVKFLMPDTVFPQIAQIGEEKAQPAKNTSFISFVWQSLSGVEVYDAEIMSLKSLAPLPEGEVLVRGDIRADKNNNIVWDIDTDKLVPGKSYILKVKAHLDEEHGSRTSESYRLFVFSAVPNRQKQITEEGKNYE